MLNSAYICVLVFAWTGSVYWSCMETSFWNIGKQNKKKYSFKALSTALPITYFMQISNPLMAVVDMIFINTLCMFFEL